MDEKRKQDYSNLIKSLLFIVIVFIVISTCTLISLKVKVAKAIIYEDNINIAINKVMDENNLHEVTITYTDDNTVQCSLNDIDYVDIKDCSFKLPVGKHTIYIKNKAIKASKEFEITSEILGTFSSPLDNIEAYYLAKGGNKKLEFNFDYPEGFDKKIKYTIDNESIISVSNDTIHGNNVGETYITATLNDGNSKKYKIIVTDLIQPITLNNNKQYLPCKRYTETEAHTLDKILESRVQEAGVGTRGAVVATARFLTMEFPYQIRYFNENGRLQGHGRPKVDGEGRYYHKGLYLSEDKYKDLVKIDTGPAMWGCSILDRFINKYNMNGFTCSGFVTWAMYNAGFDVGDVGAGDYKQFNDDLSDLGPHHEITNEYMKTGNYKVGDFIARNGHAALIIGISEDTVYTAESLPPKLEVYIYGRYNNIGKYKSLVNDDNLTYVIEMSDVYPNGEGWYTNMW